MSLRPTYPDARRKRKHFATVIRCSGGSDGKLCGRQTTSCGHETTRTATGWDLTLRGRGSSLRALTFFFGLVVYPASSRGVVTIGQCLLAAAQKRSRWLPRWDAGGHHESGKVALVGEARLAGSYSPRVHPERSGCWGGAYARLQDRGTRLGGRGCTPGLPGCATAHPSHHQPPRCSLLLPRPSGRSGS